ncbi:MAG: hypothetical protein IT424_08980 [Pirellulales bacterium]|nr:hypothetical protein [Pirellulales bacterium]
MTYLGRVENGAIVLDGAVTIPNGAKVLVEVLAAPGEEEVSSGSGMSHYERYKSVIGAAKGLPSDFAAELDHYIHGTPKKHQ